MDYGMHIADFTWNSGAAQLGPALAKHVRDAEDAGIQRITVMDHFWQLRMIGPESNEMLEAYATLAYIAAHTHSARLHTLVTGVIYREPALLAKAVTTIDVLSGGRMGLGIGAAWNEWESRGLGFEFPPIAERFGRLEEAIQICLQMWSDSEEPFDGAYYHLERTLNSPQSLSRPHPFLMIGGGGEKKTLRLVARYADACNISATADVLTKLDVLRRHCDDIGRDESDIEKTAMAHITGESTVDEVVRETERLRDAGFTAIYWFAVGMREPSAVVDLLGGALQRVG